MLNDLSFKTTCDIRPHFLGPMGGLKIEGPLYLHFCQRFAVNPVFQSLSSSAPSPVLLFSSEDQSPEDKNH